MSDRTSYTEIQLTIFSQNFNYSEIVARYLLSGKSSVSDFQTKGDTMIMQSFYISEDEAYGTRESTSSFPDTDSAMNDFYDDIIDYDYEDLEMELVF